MAELKIDPEFQSRIPPLTEAEYEQLRDNILEDGEVYEPITVWEGTIIDGHNRFKIVQEHPGIPYRVREMEFPDKWAAFDWMYKKQLGRRNLSDEQRTMLIGKMYEARKKSHGGSRGNQYAKVPSHQNDDLAKPAKTKDILAAELGIGAGTVERAEKFSKGIDAIRTVSDKAADKILRGGSGVKKQIVMDFPTMEPEEQKNLADAIESGEKIDVLREDTPASPLKHVMRDSRKHKRIDPDIDRIDAEARDPNRVREYTLADMLEEMQAISDSHTSQLRRVLDIRSDLLATSDAKEAVTAFLNESVSALNQLKELVCVSYEQ